MRRTRALLVGLVVVLATIGSSGIAGATAPGTAVAQTDDVECTFPITATDATGTDVTVAEDPERIVTLGPSAAQTMWEIGASDEVVGVTKYASYLEGASAKQNISGGSSFVEVESVVALEPDLVLAPNIAENATISKLRDAGLTVYKFERAKSMADIAQKTKFIGALTGNCGAGVKRAAEMNRTLAEIETAVQGEDSPAVLYYMGGGYTAGSNTFINKIIETAGATNVASEAGIDGYGIISEEVVLTQNPEWILTNSDIITIPKTAGYNQTTAVKEGNILVLDANEVSQPAPRVVEVTKRLAHKFHPDAFDAGPVTNETDTTDGTTTTPITTRTEGTGTSAPTTTTTPGMGILSALGALAILGLVRRTR
ncbi:MAG: PGF-CTERM-anchored ABC transporter substrate-binding protein [Halanaeroarchaeum sp.]